MSVSGPVKRHLSVNTREATCPFVIHHVFIKFRESLCDFIINHVDATIRESSCCYKDPWFTTSKQQPVYQYVMTRTPHWPRLHNDQCNNLSWQGSENHPVNTAIRFFGISWDEPSGSHVSHVLRIFLVYSTKFLVFLSLIHWVPSLSIAPSFSYLYLYSYLWSIGVPSLSIATNFWCFYIFSIGHLHFP